MAITRIPVASSFDPENETSSVATPGYDTGTTSVNTLYDRYPDGRVYATQRSAFRLSHDPDDSSAGVDTGRGMYFWEALNTIVTVNNGVVEYGYGQFADTISGGKDKVYFVETPQYLVIIDPENNEGWTIAPDDTGNAQPINDTDFPPNQTPAKNLAGGVVYLNGYVFVMDTEGNIWNSDINNARSWTAINFINASRETDEGVYITKHHDNIAAIGTQTIEFFYDAGNTVGSPLSRRTDISYRHGCTDYKSVFTSGDTITLLASDRSSTASLYQIKNFTIKKLSSPPIDLAISSILIRLKYSVVVTSATINGHELIFVCFIIDDGTDWRSAVDYVFDATTGAWTQFTTDIKSQTRFPIMDIISTIFNADISVNLMTIEGNILAVSGSMEVTEDETLGEYFLPADYLSDQTSTNPSDPTAYLYSPDPGTLPNIDMTIVTVEEDFGTSTNKFLHTLWVVGTVLSGFSTESSANLTITWTDDHYNTFSSARTLTLDGTNKRLTRLGKFKRRAFSLNYDGPNRLRIEGLELHAGVSPYA